MGDYDLPHYDPVPPGHGEPPPLHEIRDVPVCPECGAMCRRDLDGDPLDWECDRHGHVVPRWESNRSDDKEA